MKKKILLIFLMLSILMLFGCAVKEKHLEPAVEVAKSTEMLNENNSIESNGEQPETTKIPEAYQMTNYPIIGLTLTDFFQFSFAENTTLLSDMVAIVGEASGYHTDSEPYFTLYDGTTITFEINEEGYISNPYLTDALNRKFEYLYLAEVSYEFLNTEEIDRIKNGEYMPDHYSHPMSYGYVYYDRFLSISDFANSNLDLTNFGPPSGTAGSGMPWDYYQLADSSYYSYHFGQTFSPKFEVTGSKLNRIMINDYIDRTFIYKV